MKARAGEEEDDIAKALISIGVAAALGLAATMLDPLSMEDLRGEGERMYSILFTCFVSGLACVVALIGFGVSRVVAARRRRGGGACDTSTTGRAVPRILVIAMGAGLGEVFVVFVLPLLLRVTEFSIVAELTYYVVLVVAGLALATSCRGRDYAPFVVAFSVLLAITGLDVFQFVNSFSVDFQFGPEKWLYAVQRVSDKVAMLPLDVAFIFAGYFQVPKAPIPSPV